MMNKRKFLSMFLAVLMILVSFSSAIYAADSSTYTFNEKTPFLETENGAILNYKEIENNKTVFYVEKLEDNFVNTKKYHKNKNGNLKLVEEINSTINFKNDGSISVKEENLTKGTVEVKIVKKASDNSLSSLKSTRGKTWHPLHDDYYRVTRRTGHLGFDTLTKAVILGVIGGLISGGRVVKGTLATVTVAILDGKIRNCYFEEETYYPYGSGHKGDPLWRKIIKYYRNSNLTNKIGNTIYVDSDAACKF